MNLTNLCKREIYNCCKKIYQLGFFVGNEIRFVIIAVSYFILRKNQVGYSLNELLMFGNIPDNESKRLKRLNGTIRRLFLFLKKNNLDRYLCCNCKKTEDTFINKYTQIFNRYLEKYQISTLNHNKYHIFINNFLKSKLMNGKNPLGFVGSFVYFVSLREKQPITQKQISDDLNVNQATIRQYLSFLSKSYQKQWNE
jgi:transcription initiation factor TFIIIB Brf1 subunit/transcription initiation factor TFIIB